MFKTKPLYLPAYYFIVNNDHTCHPQTAELNKDLAARSETLVTSRSEIGEIRRLLQTLEIKLQAQLSKVSASNTSVYTDRV